jgi:hypothetical protein
MSVSCMHMGITHNTLLGAVNRTTPSRSPLIL